MAYLPLYITTPCLFHLIAVQHRLNCPILLGGFHLRYQTVQSQSYDTPRSNKHLQNEQQTTRMLNVQRCGATEHTRGNGIKRDNVSLAAARLGWRYVYTEVRPSGEFLRIMRPSCGLKLASPVETNGSQIRVTICGPTNTFAQKRPLSVTLDSVHVHTA